MFCKHSRLLCLGVCLLVAVATLGSVGCTPKDAFAFVKDFNPVGTIIPGDPVQYRFLTSGYEGPGVNPEIDPACTYPPYCQNDPFISSMAQAP